MPRIPPDESWRWYPAFLICLCGCTTNAVDDRAFMSQLTPDEWRHPGAWTFHIVDNQHDSLGHIVLLLTDEGIGADSCVDSYWKKATIIDDGLDFDFGFEKRPAYNVKGPWITIDLTASTCNVHHKLVGDVDSEGAVGSFNYIDLLDSYSIGTFTAKPVVD